MTDLTPILDQITSLTTFFGTFITIILGILAVFVGMLAFLLWRHNELRKKAEKEISLLEEMRKRSEEDAQAISEVAKAVEGIASGMLKEKKLARKRREEIENIYEKASSITQAYKRKRLARSLLEGILHTKVGPPKTRKAREMEIIEERLRVLGGKKKEESRENDAKVSG